METYDFILAAGLILDMDLTVGSIVPMDGDGFSVKSRERHGSVPALQVSVNSDGYMIIHNDEAVFYNWTTGQTWRLD